MRGIVAGLGLVMISGCAARSWVHLEHQDPQQTAEDKYECMKENSFVFARKRADRSEASAAAGTEVNEPLFRACMEARGYERARAEGGPLPQARMPEHGPVVVSLEAGSSNGFVLASTREISSSGGEARVADQRASVWGDGPIRLAGALGIAVHTGPLVDVGIRLGVRGTEASSEIDCQESDGNWRSCSTDQRFVGVAPAGSVDARARLPFFPRAWGSAGFGLQPTLAVPDRTVDVSTLAFEDSPSGDLLIPGSPAYLVPSARLALGMDFLYAEPHGLGASCGADVMITNSRVEGDPSGWRTVTSWCTLAYRLSVGPRR